MGLEIPLPDPNDPSLPSVAPPRPPIPAPPSLTDLYIKARTAGASDTDAALAVAQHLRQQADIRSGFRRAGDIAAGRPVTGDAYRAQLMGEADRPLQDLAARRAVEPLAMEQAQHAGSLAGADIAAQQAAQLRDPSHPTNVAMRDAFSKMGLTPPPGLTVAALPKEMWETVKPLAELTGKQKEIEALAPGRAAEAGKARAEAGKTRALTGPEVAKTSAEASKSAAEAAVEAQKIGGQVAPGYVRSGRVANVSDKEIQDFRGQASAAQKSAHIIDQLTTLLGESDFVTKPEKMAKAAVLGNQLMLASKEAAGIRGLPQGDVAFLKQMTGDLSMFKVSNLLGLTKNPTRLRTLKASIKAGLDSDAQTLGLDPVGGAAPASGTNTGRMIGKSGKPFDWVDGKGWMPATDERMAVRTQ